MTDVVVHLESAALRYGRFTARLGRSLYRAMIAHGTRRALDELPDTILRDIGVARSDTPFVGVALASGDKDPTRDALNRPVQTVAERDAALSAKLGCLQHRVPPRCIALDSRSELLRTPAQNLHSLKPHLTRHVIGPQQPVDCV